MASRVRRRTLPLVGRSALMIRLSAAVVLANLLERNTHAHTARSKSQLISWLGQRKRIHSLSLSLSLSRALCPSGGWLAGFCSRLPVVLVVATAAIQPAGPAALHSGGSERECEKVCDRSNSDQRAPVGCLRQYLSSGWIREFTWASALASASAAAADDDCCGVGWCERQQIAARIDIGMT